MEQFFKNRNQKKWFCNVCVTKAGRSISGAHGSLIISVRLVSKGRLFKPRFGHCFCWCVLRQGTLSTSSQSNQLKSGTGICKEFTPGGLVFHQGGVNLLSTTNIREKHRLNSPWWFGEGLF